MSIKALSGIAPEWFAPKQDDEENPTRFKIKPLSGIEHLEVLSNCDGYLLTGKGITAALKSGVVDWENFNDVDGNEIEFSFSKFGLIPALVVNELADRIMELSTLRDKERKNSSLQLKSEPSQQTSIAEPAPISTATKS